MARVRSLPKVRGVGVEGVCIWEVAGSRAYGIMLLLVVSGQLFCSPKFILPAFFFLSL